MGRCPPARPAGNQGQVSLSRVCSDPPSELGIPARKPPGFQGVGLGEPARTKKAPPPRLRGRGRAHGLPGECNGSWRKGPRFSKGTVAPSLEVEWRTVLRPRSPAPPGPRCSPRLAALPEPAERHVCSERLLHTSRVFIRSLPGARSGRARKKEKNTYLAALRGQPRGPAAGEGAPRSHFPPGRSPHGPSLPPWRSTPPVIAFKI